MTPILKPGIARLQLWYPPTRREHEWHQWVERAEKRLMTKTSAELWELGKKFYVGCGFHYDLQQELGTMISRLAIPVKDIGIRIVYQVRVEALHGSIRRAQDSIKFPATSRSPSRRLKA